MAKKAAVKDVRSRVGQVQEPASLVPSLDEEKGQWGQVFNPGFVHAALLIPNRADASNLVRVSGAQEYFFEKILVQGGSFAFAGDAVLGRIALQKT